MKKTFYLLIFLLSGSEIFAQSVTINPSASNSSIVNVQSTNKGVLVPNMTTVQRTAIVSPQKGLLVFDTNTNSFWFHNGTVWSEINSSTTKPAFLATSSSQFIPTDGATFVGLEIFDITNSFDAATGIFTAPSDGIYQFTVSINWIQSGTGKRFIYKNFISNPTLLSSVTASGLQVPQAVTFMLNMITNQTLSIFLAHDIPSGGTSISNSQSFGFSGFKVN
jgi:hypothetical protein